MQALLKHIAKFTVLDAREQQLVASVFGLLEVGKKAVLSEAGDKNPKLFFVCEGCIRMYALSENGNEQTLQFAIENWWLADLLSVHNQSPSTYYIQAIETSSVAVIDKNAFEDLLEAVPKLERYFRRCFQKAAGAAQKRIQYLFTLSAEQRYHNINDHFPEFVQRVPQYMLASYLDFSAEFMSKIRSGKTGNLS